MNILANLDKITQINITIPLWHVLLFLLLTILLMLMGRFRFITIGVYWFSFTWIFIKNENALSKILTSQPQFTFAFLVTGAILIGLSIWVFFIEGE